jgi:LysM repeat protein
MPQLLDEREPGVYVRSNRPENELDFLWDRDRKREGEPDRFHLGFFFGGFVVGSVVTLAGCLIFFWGGNIMPGAGNTDPAVVVEEQTVVTPKDLSSAVAAETAKSAPKEEAKIGLPFFTNRNAKEQETPEAKHAQTEVKARLYEVQPGDTLGSIAIKFYESSAPDYVEKIQRANQMDDAHTLKVGQRLSIPPKSY